MNGRALLDDVLTMIFLGTYMCLTNVTIVNRDPLLIYSVRGDTGYFLALIYIASIGINVFVFAWSFVRWLILFVVRFREEVRRRREIKRAKI